MEAAARGGQELCSDLSFSDSSERNGQESASSQIKKSRRAEGMRAGERSIKQLSGSKVHWPLTSPKRAAGSSGLSIFCDKKALPQESPLPGARRKDGRLDRALKPWGNCPLAN